ncbi:hypothetical protein F2Q68_00045160 [Brassica cretica]|uniref:Uncharacterized protein n=1 Tax=Brassica cretica TaxID=69181 RepID=A0A8S9LNG7_BRACR|nr:hypothetical protein F2Q68_00045160 [Brassica cretica]
MNFSFNYQCKELQLCSTILVHSHSGFTILVSLIATVSSRLISSEELHVSHLHLLLLLFPKYSSPPASKERNKKKQIEVVITQNSKHRVNVSEPEPGEIKDTKMGLCLNVTFVVA